MDEFLNLAAVYDQLVGANYQKICNFILNKIKAHLPHADIGVDLGCGSGTLTKLLAGAGLDMIGIDASPAMLAKAAEKQDGAQILYLQQPMDEMDLYGTADVFVSTLDSINYLENKQALRRLFERVSLFSNAGALFIFDINTLHKYWSLHEQNLVYETDDAVVIWENEFDGRSMYYDLLYFYKTGALYKRAEDHQIQTYFEPDEIVSLLKKSGFRILSIQDDYTDQAPKEKTERMVFTAQKE